jgi:Leucine-rich repeat (LRR) protein
MDHILMLLCFLIMVATLPVSAATVNGRAMLEDAHEKRDVEALLSFKKHIKSDPSGRLSDWTAENSQNVCSWHGITCRGHTRRVVAIILPVLVPLLDTNLRLEGTLSASLGNLSLLQTLNLNGNNLTGGIPPDFGRLKALRILDLSWNNLGGSIQALCNCTRLKWIELSWNIFTGTIPTEFGRLVDLERLDLSVNNYLGGSIPTSLSNCTSLREFSIESNNFTGPIPS